eukprot:Sspe_Gene.107337::Locus_85445_Transcript_1_1_Confidence_1.000_Length_1025::g.107337::m.107337
MHQTKMPFTAPANGATRAPAEDDEAYEPEEFSPFSSSLGGTLHPEDCRPDYFSECGSPSCLDRKETEELLIMLRAMRTNVDLRPALVWLQKHRSKLGHILRVISAHVYFTQKDREYVAGVFNIVMEMVQAEQAPLKEVSEALKTHFEYLWNAACCPEVSLSVSRWQKMLESWKRTKMWMDASMLTRLIALGQKVTCRPVSVSASPAQAPVSTAPGTGPAAAVLKPMPRVAPPQVSAVQPGHPLVVSPKGPQGAPPSALTVARGPSAAQPQKSPLPPPGAPPPSSSPPNPQSPWKALSVPP